MINLQNDLGSPHRITYEAMMQVAKFAEDELALLIVSGGSGLGTGLPLTENQLTKKKLVKNEDKRAAARCRHHSPQQCNLQ